MRNHKFDYLNTPQKISKLHLLSHQRQMSKLVNKTNKNIKINVMNQWWSKFFPSVLNSVPCCCFSVHKNNNFTLPGLNLSWRPQISKCFWNMVYCFVTVSYFPLCIMYTITKAKLIKFSKIAIGIPSNY